MNRYHRMSLWLLLVVGLCLAEVVLLADSFDFRSNCIVTHHQNKFSSAICDRVKHHIEQKDLVLDTAVIANLQLKFFNSITVTRKTYIEKLTITDTKNVTVHIDTSSLTSLTIDRVDELTLKSNTMMKINVKELDNITLTNVKKLRLENDGESAWFVRSVRLDNVEDMDLESSSLKISARSIAVLKCHIRAKGRRALTLKASSVHINGSTLYVYDNGSFAVTADNFSIEDSFIDMENGTILLLNSKKVAFSNNSFYDFQKNSVQTAGISDVEFINNEIFTSDLANVLATASKSYRFTNNRLNCDSCIITETVISSNFQIVEDTNYCYLTCNLTLSKFRELLTNNSICDKTNLMLDRKVLCTQNGTTTEDSSLVPDKPSSSIDFDLLRTFLFIAIPVLLITSLFFCICHKDNINKCKEMLTRSVLPQELECQRRDGNAQEANQMEIIHTSHMGSYNPECLYELVGNNPGR